MSNLVSFTEMKRGSKADFKLLQKLEVPYYAQTATRLLRELESLADDSLSGYKVTRLEHVLQGASRAHRSGADIDWVVGALLHDIGDGLAPQNHDRFAAEILRPFVREEVSWVIGVHGVFQTYYYGHHYGWDRNAREKFKGHIYYQSAIDFCEQWDQNCFDPNYDYEPLDFFKPMVEQVFARKIYDSKVLQVGVVKGVPPLVG